MATFIAEILNSIHNINHTAAGDLSAGAVIVQSELVGILPSNLATGELGALCILGEIELPKPVGVGTDYAVGTELFWDVAEVNAKSDSEAGANKTVGRVIAQPATTDTHVRVFLQPA